MPRQRRPRASPAPPEPGARPHEASPARNRQHILCGLTFLVAAQLGWIPGCAASRRAPTVPLLPERVAARREAAAPPATRSRRDPKRHRDGEHGTCDPEAGERGRPSDPRGGEGTTRAAKAGATSPDEGCLAAAPSPPAASRTPQMLASAPDAPPLPSPSTTPTSERRRARTRGRKRGARSPAPPEALEGADGPSAGPKRGVAKRAREESPEASHIASPERPAPRPPVSPTALTPRAAAAPPSAPSSPPAAPGAGARSARALACAWATDENRAPVGGNEAAPRERQSPRPPGKAPLPAPASPLPGDIPTSPAPPFYDEGRASHSTEGASVPVGAGDDDVAGAASTPAPPLDHERDRSLPPSGAGAGARHRLPPSPTARAAEPVVARWPHLCKGRSRGAALASAAGLWDAPGGETETLRAPTARAPLPPSHGEASAASVPPKGGDTSLRSPRPLSRAPRSPPGSSTASLLALDLPATQGRRLSSGSAQLASLRPAFAAAATVADDPRTTGIAESTQGFPCLQSASSGGGEGAALRDGAGEGATPPPRRRVDPAASPAIGHSPGDLWASAPSTRSRDRDAATPHPRVRFCVPEGADDDGDDGPSTSAPSAPSPARTSRRSPRRSAPRLSPAALSARAARAATLDLPFAPARRPERTPESARERSHPRWLEEALNTRLRALWRAGRDWARLDIFGVPFEESPECGTGARLCDGADGRADGRQSGCDVDDDGVGCSGGDDDNGSRGPTLRDDAGQGDGRRDGVDEAERDLSRSGGRERTSADRGREPFEAPSLAASSLEQLERGWAALKEGRLRALAARPRSGGILRGGDARHRTPDGTPTRRARRRAGFDSLPLPRPVSLSESPRRLADAEPLPRGKGERRGGRGSASERGGAATEDAPPAGDVPPGDTLDGCQAPPGDAPPGGDGAPTAPLARGAALGLLGPEHAQAPPPPRQASGSRGARMALWALARTEGGARVAGDEEAASDRGAPARQPARWFEPEPEPAPAADSEGEPAPASDSGQEPALSPGRGSAPTAVDNLEAPPAPSPAPPSSPPQSSSPAPPSPRPASPSHPAPASVLSAPKISRGRRLLDLLRSAAGARTPPKFQPRGEGPETATRAWLEP